MSECPGAGRCHGCTRWCDVCGDVGTVCGYPECQQHHCSSCRELLGPDDRSDWESLCSTCALASVNDDIRQRFERALIAGDFTLADVHARDLDLNPDPTWPEGVPWTSAFSMGVCR